MAEKALHPMWYRVVYLKRSEWYMAHHLKGWVSVYAASVNHRRLATADLPKLKC